MDSRYCVLPRRNGICVYKGNPLDQAFAPKASVWNKRSEGLTPGCAAKGQKTESGCRVVKLMVALSYDKGVAICN